MAVDTLLWGNTRPRIRVGTSVQTNGTNYVFNQPPAAVPDEHFPKHIILNESALTIYLNEHIIKRRGIFTFDYEYLDRPSCERLIDILNSSSAKYLRPHFNFWKEYQVRCVNEWELDNLEKSNQPYQGTLQFETISGEDTIPSESSGSFNFDGSTYVGKSLGSSITGDISIELWIKTPSTVSGSDRVLVSFSGTPTWEITLTAYSAKWQLKFITGGSNTLTCNTLLTADTWYFIQIRRVNTDDKYIVLNGVQRGSTSDSLAANSINIVQLGGSSSDFNGLCQIFRVYNDDLDENYYSKHSIEAIDSTAMGNIKLWWDFSQGSANDLGPNNNDGSVSGTEQYYEESFLDNGSEYMT